MLRKLVAVSMLIFIAGLLSGCVYTFDFAAEGDLTNSSGTWEQLAGTVTEFAAEDGAFLQANTIRAPVAFTGDYTVDYYFKPVYSGGSSVEMAFSLQGDSGNFAGIKVEGFELQASYKLEWGLPEDHIGASLNPSVENLADNILRLEKTGNLIIVSIDEGTAIGTIILPPGFASEYWAPEIMGNYLGSVYDDGIYISKVKVTYDYGNMMER